jgi:hypothetical protein
MTSAQAIAKIRLLIDRIGSPYFEDSEILDFLNLAQLEVLNRMVPDSLGGVVNFELDSNTAQNVARLTYTFNSTPPNVTYSSINTQLQSQSGDSSAQLFRILALYYTINGTSVPVRYVRHNDYIAITRNVFKTPDASNPIYTISTSTGSPGSLRVTVAPTLNTTNSLTFTVLKTPKIMESGNSPDWDDYVMNQVILQAVKLIGVPTRDEELIVDARNTGIQSAQ